MPSHKTRLSALLLAGGVLFAAAGANAAGMRNDDIFCKAIGLSLEGQAQCVEQLAGTINDDDRASVQAMWVSRSAVGERPWSGSLYQPVVDTNHLNGTPGTPYQDKPRFIPNTVAMDIQRAVRTVATNPPETF
jgi:hypothetical protein